jgi:hypothetical protein
MRISSDFTLDDVDFSRKTVSIEQNEDLLDRLSEKEVKPALSPEEIKSLEELWDMVEFVCGGKRTADFIIMYQLVDQGNSLRELAEMWGVSHMAISKRYKKIVNKLKFLVGTETNVIPYRRDRGGEKL